MSDWQNLTPYGVPIDGATAIGGGGRTLSGYRDIADARRSAAGPFTPEASYPDGYLGTINTRRGDRLLASVQQRLTERNYQRGVHKGEKMGSDSYFWPDDFNPQSGLEAEARGEKWTAIGSTPAEQINHIGQLINTDKLERVAAQYGINAVTPVDPVRQAQLKRLTPTWS